MHRLGSYPHANPSAPAATIGACIDDITKARPAPVGAPHQINAAIKGCRRPTRYKISIGISFYPTRQRGIVTDPNISCVAV